MFQYFMSPLITTGVKKKEFNHFESQLQQNPLFYCRWIGDLLR